MIKAGEEEARADTTTVTGVPQSDFALRPPTTDKEEKNAEPEEAEEAMAAENAKPDEAVEALVNEDAMPDETS